MRRQLLAYLLVVLVAGPLLAEPKTLVRLDGWIVDSYCGAKNANVESAEDTLACHKKGAKLILIATDGTSYSLANQKKALEHVGELIKVFGMVDKDRNLEIKNYIGSAPGPLDSSKELPARTLERAKPEEPSEPERPERG